MFNFRRFLCDSSSESKHHLLVSHDVEKTELLFPPQTTPKKDGKLTLFAKSLLLTLILASTIFLGQPIAIFAVRAYHATVHCDQAPINIIEPPVAPPKSNKTFFPAATPWKPADILRNRGVWKVDCSSGKETCNNTIDGKKNTEWKSATSPGTTHWTIIDLGEEHIVHSLRVTTSSKYDYAGGPRNHKVEVGTTLAALQVVAYGAWRDVGGAAIFEPSRARYIKLSAIDTHETPKDKGFIAITDIEVWTLNELFNPLPGGGKWTHTVDFPLVPVTAWLNPKTGRVVTVSSDDPNRFGDADKNPIWTMLSEWDPSTLKATDEKITETNHNIFCPGTSMDKDGQVLFTGGSSSALYSIYDSEKSQWVKPVPNKIIVPRGYQGQTYLSDGRTFMIGGTWSGLLNDTRDGEIYNPDAQGEKWKVVRKISANKYINMSRPMCDPASGSKDRGCEETNSEQHHPWLFAWKNGSVLHARPSKQMNWFFLTEHHEEVAPIGNRLNDGDAVCGSAVMYDAVAGSIVTAGGAPNYHYWVDAGNHAKGYRFPATNNVFGLTLGKPGESVNPKKLAPMKSPRIFGNAVILPTGEIFIAGGQTKGEGFYDDEWVPTPEIYDPIRDTWREASRNSIPRTYHSWGLLLPDATVLVGGGGLGDREAANHYDAQIYEPGYLLTGAPRPKFKGSGIEKYQLGSKVSIQTEGEVDLDASLIRYSAVTHSLNNDLRRIHLKLEAKGKMAGGGFEYTVVVPGDPGVALPGYWMLFVLKGGVPSVAKTVQLLNMK